jgi:hypothetical protein
VTFTDEGGATVTDTGAITVTDVPLTPTGATAYAAQGTSGTTLTLATFIDANPNSSATDFAATINWGDNSAPSAGAVSGDSRSYTVTGSHSYATTGAFATTITIQDVTSTATVGGSVIVTTMNPTAQPVAAAEGAALNNVPVATFTDIQPSTYTASINWGDGTAATSGTVTGSSGSYSVLGSHTYA